MMRRCIFNRAFGRHYTVGNGVGSKIIGREVTQYGITVKLQQNGLVKEQYLDHILLRDASKSPNSVDPISSQKLFTTGSLLVGREGLEPIRPGKADIVDDGQGLYVHWNDGDQFTYTTEYLQSLNEESVSIKKFKPEVWSQELMSDKGFISGLSVDYHSYMNPHDDMRLFETVKLLDQYGIGLITDIPDEAATNYSDWFVQMICERIGHVRTTFYGDLFDVQNQASQANNIAYTTKPLPLHMDLLYLENIPGWQMLHCIKNSEGSHENGQNYFVDSLAALEYIKRKDVSVMKALETIPITYHYKRDDKRYYQQRPLVEHKKHETVVNYSPPFQGPFNFKETSDIPLLNQFKKGLSMFEEYINDPKNQFQIKLPENSCVIFHNRRILHARRQFDGERWLKGCYLDADTFSSKLSNLYEKFK
ncbi:unnamed protein product [Kluyveromyces dobzhanskii CBS 2104]|uniref:WGS project CCBQ000000000 data, contig 00102 n=1 Tax=Kluyveromyces dobzhanskii CBS 2104 TaxID=1427455 RepID=A0A0A8L6N0_9SACH|nr:unnamed protein product [Kluyveromyces dobzhanskii CBS 2104]